MANEFRENQLEATKALTSMTYILLASNNIGTIIRAYASGNNWFLGFIFFIYSSFFLLECCYQAYHRLPRGQKSARKNFLGVAIWCLFSGIMFGFTYQLAPLFSLPLALPMYAVVLAGSATMFYVYIIHDDSTDNPQCDDKFCDNKTGYTYTSGGAGGDSKTRFSFGHVDIIFEQV